MSCTSPTPRGWRMVACDLDGTLIGWDHKTNERDLEALRRARAAGLHVMIVTGRHAGESAGVIGALGLAGPGVFANGAMVAEMATGVTLDAQPMGATLVDEAITFFGTRGYAVLTLLDEPQSRRPEYIITSHGRPHRATLDWLAANRVHALPQDHIGAPLRAHIVRVGVCIDVADALALERELRAQFGPRLFSYSVYSPTYDCQVMDTFGPGVNKWSGIVHACGLLGIAPEEVVTIGDDVNDLAMLEGARLSFAMGTASPAVQRRAKRVTRAQADAGVAEVIDMLLRGEC